MAGSCSQNRIRSLPEMSALFPTETKLESPSPSTLGVVHHGEAERAALRHEADAAAGRRGGREGRVQPHLGVRVEDPHAVGARPAASPRRGRRAAAPPAAPAPPRRPPRSRRRSPPVPAPPSARTPPPPPAPSSAGTTTTARSTGAGDALHVRIGDARSAPRRRSGSPGAPARRSRSRAGCAAPRPRWCRAGARRRSPPPSAGGRRAHGVHRRRPVAPPRSAPAPPR